MKKMTNLTPHEVVIVCNEGNLVIPASGAIARVAVTSEQVDEVNGIPVVRTVYSKEVEGLPQPEEGTIYIVSTLVAQACPDRHDLFVPANLIRDEQGRVVGASALQRFF